jgi:hypothetical protein
MFGVLSMMAVYVGWLETDTWWNMEYGIPIYILMDANLGCRFIGEPRF